MNATSEQVDSASFQEVCTIVVLYDDPASRARAMAACHYLVGQFWPDIELKFHWWRTDFLRDPTLAAVASDNASVADFLIVASESNLALSPAMEAWFESWLSRRFGRQGALVDLRVARLDSASGWESLLKEICQRGNFDYLTTMPATHGNPANASQKMNGLVDDILGESRPPSHYGLNE